MMRRLALSYWTLILIGLGALALHVAWAIWWEPMTKRGEIVTGFGAFLIVLGLLVAARPYIRAGVRQLVDDEAGPAPTDRLYDALAGQRLPVTVPEELLHLVERNAYVNRRAEIRRDVMAERVVAVGIIIIGTVLNGYGPLIMRKLGLEV